MSNSKQTPSLGEAAALFLNSLPPEKREESQPEIYKFIRWYGWERLFSGITAPEVANYAERLSFSNTDYIKKLGIVRAFLTYAKKKGWSRGSLAIHLKARKEIPKAAFNSRRRVSEAVSLTQQGYSELEAELASLKERRLESIEEVRRAAADKDFRENAPLEAAREQRGQLEGRIRELEETLKSATIIGEKQTRAFKVGIGDSVLLRNLTSGEELRYILVDPKEVDPTRGRISPVSPIGKAIIGRSEEEVLEIIAPAGKLRYQIQRIEPPTT